MAVPPVASTSELNGTSLSSLTPELFRRLHPRPYLAKFLSDGLRPDGRPLLASEGRSEDIWRTASVNIGSISTAPSSALVKLGDTIVVCGLTLEIAPPDITSPTIGFLVPNIELSALCSPLFRPGPPSDEAQVLSHKLKEILLASQFLPLSSLLIEKGKAAFVVYLDVTCLNYGGGVLDASVLACVGALKHLVLPETKWDPDTGLCTSEHVTESTPGQKINFGPSPSCVSFGVFEGHLLPDPTLFEAGLCTSLVTVVTSNPSNTDPKLAKKAGRLIQVYQGGSILSNPSEKGIGENQIKKCIAMARLRAVELLALL